MQRHYEHNRKLKSWTLMSKQCDLYERIIDLSYWARKDVEAFEEKEMLPRFNRKTFETYKGNILFNNHLLRGGVVFI